MKKQILFVDDDSFVLAALGRLLRSHREVWDVEFAENGQQALQRMQEKPFDVIVSDMRMPGMDGTELLSEVRRRYPRTVRIILSGQSDETVRLRAVGPAHQYLSKPCDPLILKQTIERACLLRTRLANDSLRRLISEIQTLPSLPDAYHQLLAELRSGEASLERIAEVISTDIAMTAKVLQMVNSSFFGLAQRITSPVSAVRWLGIRNIAPLALTAGVFSQIDANLPGLDVTGLVNHSLAVAARAREFAKAWSGDDAEAADDAFLAGMLHDVGKLVLATNLPFDYQGIMDSATNRGVPLWEAETEVFDASHAEVGGYLAGLWGLPDAVIEAIAFHHAPQPTNAGNVTPLTAVHVADALEHFNHATENGISQQLAVNQAYLTQLGILGCVTDLLEQQHRQVVEAFCNE